MTQSEFTPASRIPEKREEPHYLAGWLNSITRSSKEVELEKDICPNASKQLCQDDCVRYCAGKGHSCGTCCRPAFTCKPFEDCGGYAARGLG